uniref:Uncharacterized protein n=1 Tax=Heterorhabditis bacteriophora TaxID=37862 RepID=A0A1I7WPS7_HETBA
MPTPAKNVNSKSGGNSTIMNSMQRNEMSPSNKRVDPMCQSSRPESVGSENRETVSNSSLKELRQIQTSAQIPPGVMLGMSSAPTIHSTKCGNVEYIVIMLDPPPCECEQLNNKRKKCKNHKKGQGTKRGVDVYGGKSGKNNAMVVREDNIEQQGAVDEKRAEDSEKETRVLGSYTPDKICIAGPAGIPVLIDIRKTGSSLAEPRIEMIDGVVKGILVRGPNDCPQFIPESVIQKNTDRTPKNINYTPGKLLRDPNGATVFHANISETDASRRCQNMNTYQADAKITGEDRVIW